MTGDVGAEAPPRLGVMGAVGSDVGDAVGERGADDPDVVGDNGDPFRHHVPW